MQLKVTVDKTRGIGVSPAAASADAGLHLAGEVGGSTDATTLEGTPGVVPASITDPAQAATRALVIGARFGRVVLAPLGSGASDTARRDAVRAACSANGWPFIQSAGTWYDGTVSYTVPAPSDDHPSRPSPLHLASWVAERPSAYATDPTITLPSWMTFAGAVCNNSGKRAVQISASSVVVLTVGDNIAVWTSNDGISGGLSLGPPTKNYVKNSGPWDKTKTGWADGGTLGAAATGPDGTANSAYSWPLTSTATYSAGFDIGAPGMTANGVYSLWGKKGDVVGTPVAKWFCDQPPNDFGFPCATTSWARTYELRTTGSEDGFIRLAGAGSSETSFAYGAQVEINTKVPTELIITGDSTSSRTAGSFTVTGLTTFLPGGCGCVTLGWRPWYASTEPSTDDKLLPFTATDYLIYNYAANTLSLYLGGVEALVTSAITFSAFQKIAICVTILPGFAAIRINGATTGDGLYSTRDASKAIPIGTVSNTMTYTAVVGNPWDLWALAFDYPRDPSCRDETVLCIGDSIVAFAEWQQQAWKRMLQRGINPIWVGSRVTNGIRNEGHGGYNLTQLSALSFNAARTYKPTWVYFQGGTNDVASAGDTPGAGAAMLAIVADAAAQIMSAGVPGDHILVGSIPPYAADPGKDVGRIAFNAGLSAQCTTSGAVYCDAFGSMPTELLAVDNVHPSHPAPLEGSGMGYGGDRIGLMIG